MRGHETPAFILIPHDEEEQNVLLVVTYKNLRCCVHSLSSHLRDYNFRERDSGGIVELLLTTQGLMLRTLAAQ